MKRYRRTKLCLIMTAVIYLSMPVIAGALEIGDLTGPRIYPESLHSFLYQVGWEFTEHEAKEPRYPFGDPDRPWFYFLD